MDVSIAIATFGHARWRKMAESRAIPSAEAQGVPVIHEHVDGTLAEARNAALVKVTTEWVVHLDADDELDPGYIEAIAGGSADVRAPAVRYIPGGGPAVPNVYGHTHDCVAECLRYGNWLVIGAAVRTEMARSIGWEEFGWSEDWAMWARCWVAGATFESIPDAVYVAYRNRQSRNRISRMKSLHWHRAIEAAVWPDEASVL